MVEGDGNSPTKSGKDRDNFYLKQFSTAGAAQGSRVGADRMSSEELRARVPNPSLRDFEHVT